LFLQAGLGYLDAEYVENIEVALWGKNLSDKKYAAYAFDLRQDFGFVPYMRGVPRTLGIDLKYSF